jgi:hypothetical protein
MGRAKIISTEKKEIELITTSCSLKYMIPVTTENDLGEYIRIERRENQYIIYFTRKPNNTGVIAKEGIIVSFD